ncbi:MAG TPA: hemerythrin domain-containing protein [Acidimicrobiales bacterium]|nr:hemerythrin domain-containing protein [Acidimicrobiales bacterium]
MAHLIRFLMQDHARINRALEAYANAPSNLSLALTACGEFEAHSAIEQDLVYPVLRDEVDADEAEAAEEEHAQVQEMIDQVSDMEPGDPELPIVMKNLTNAIANHVDYEERVLFPALQKVLGTRVWDIGREAFGYRQELQGQIDRPGNKSKPIANTGWTPSKVANAGW